MSRSWNPGVLPAPSPLRRRAAARHGVQVGILRGLAAAFKLDPHTMMLPLWVDVTHWHDAAPARVRVRTPLLYDHADLERKMERVTRRPWRWTHEPPYEVAGWSVMETLGAEGLLVYPELAGVPPPFQVLLGRDDRTGQPVVHNLAPRGGDAHGMVVGQNGRGKSNVLRLYVCHFAEAGVFDTTVLDPKGELEQDVAGSGVEAFSDLGDCAEVVASFRAGMEARLATARRWGVRAAEIADRETERGTPGYHVLVIDEATDLVHPARARGTADQQLRLQIGEDLGVIARMGRSAWYRLVLGIHRPDSDILKGPLRDEIGFRLALWLQSPEAYRMVLGRTPDVLPHKRPGSAVAASDYGEHRRARLYYLAEERLGERLLVPGLGNVRSSSAGPPRASADPRRRRHAASAGDQQAGEASRLA